MCALSVENCLQGVLTLLAVIAIGVYLGKKGVISDRAEEAITSLTVRFSIPFLLFDNAREYITVDFLKEIGPWLLIPFTVILASSAISLLLASFFKVKKEDRGMFMILFAYSNSILIGLPIVTEIFGKVGTPYNIAYYIPNTLLFWTIGNMALAKDGGKQFKIGLGTLRLLLSPALLGLFFGMAVSFSGIKLPHFVDSTIGYMSDLTIPLTLLMTGVFLARMGKEAFKFGKTGTIILIGRLIITPALALGFCLIFKGKPMLTGVYTVVAAMPVMNQSVLMARHYGSNYKLGAQMLTVTTLLSVVMMPALVYLLSVLT